MVADNLYYVENLYSLYLQDPNLVDSDWRLWFSNNGPSLQVKLQGIEKTQEISRFFQQYGHLWAQLDPLNLNYPNVPHFLQNQKNVFEQHPDFHLFFEKYSQKIGYEFCHLESEARRLWWEHKIEGARHQISHEDYMRYAEILYRSVEFENSLKKKFPGAKRFGLEGLESFIVGLDVLFHQACSLGAKEFVLAMAHRGRFNVMTNFMGMPYGDFVTFFEDNGAVSIQSPHYTGDVKYHLGYNTQRSFETQDISLKMLPNSSHLESINPVAMGFTYCRQKQLSDNDFRFVVPILVHGDASFVGQGVVAESLNLSLLQNYYIGGAIHVILNNQIGFTTNPADGRSTRYASDLAKGFQVPVIHVNADEIDSVIKAFQYAYDFKNEFKSDVIIDLIGYRRMGHNEMDEPSFTQPVMYQVIQNHPHVYKIYKSQLIAQNADWEDQFITMEKNVDKEFTEDKKSTPAVNDKKKNSTKKSVKIVYGLARKELSQVFSVLTSVPSGFFMHPKIEKQMQSKRESFEQDKVIDWALAESLAFASILEKGTSIRLAGQDTSRGTFSQRHLRIYDYRSNESYVPLNNIKQGSIEIVDSPLSEFSCLGFEYGISLDEEPFFPIWEAQFGDFHNGAQIIVDQYIAGSFTKWNQRSNLTLLLPHGFEGQGSEHSSARLERFLQLCAHENMRVANCSTPANYFHLLRQQALGGQKRPLIVMTPKSLLRLPEAVSDVNDFLTKKTFQPIIFSDEPIKVRSVRKVIFCSGKIFYDLDKFRLLNQIQNVIIVRVEQLYPFPHDEIKLFLKRFKAVEVLWCQEEPINMGAWSYAEKRIVQILKEIKHIYGIPNVVARPECSVPATGFLNIHNIEQAELFKKAFQ